MTSVYGSSVFDRLKYGQELQVSLSPRAVVRRELRAHPFLAVSSRGSASRFVDFLVRKYGVDAVGRCLHFRVDTLRREFDRFKLEGFV